MLERIHELMNDRGITEAELTREAKLGNGIFTQWKNGKAKPSTDVILKLSNYFNVTTDYLIKGDGALKTFPALSEEYAILLTRIKTIIDNGTATYSTFFEFTTYSADEYKLVDRWEDLDADGKAAVRLTIRDEEQRMENEAKTPDQKPDKQAIS